ncbi:hypothetical protein HMPREF1869_00057 [Bacteroidales bacterium KA00251]|nr:hypothetical protein HMPREF1869_00057 [Bacteroidales bacterium KA00251]
MPPLRDLFCSFLVGTTERGRSKRLLNRWGEGDTCGIPSRNSIFVIA